MKSEIVLETVSRGMFSADINWRDAEIVTKMADADGNPIPAHISFEDLDEFVDFLDAVRKKVTA